MHLTNRIFLKSLLVILISSNSFSQELPNELRTLICDLNERVLETTSEQKTIGIRLELRVLRERNLIALLAKATGSALRMAKPF